VPQAVVRRTPVGGVLSWLVGCPFNLRGRQATPCRIPCVHSVCRQFGLGGVPTAAQERAFAAARAEGCDGLRAFLRDGRGGTLMDDAERLINARRTMVDTGWAPRERALPMFL